MKSKKVKSENFTKTCQKHNEHGKRIWLVQLLKHRSGVMPGFCQQDISSQAGA